MAPVSISCCALPVLSFPSQAGAEPAEKMIRELVACEHEYINTDHPDFIGGTRAVKVMTSLQAKDALVAMTFAGDRDDP